MSKKRRKILIILTIVFSLIAIIIFFNKTVIVNIQNQKYSQKLLKEQEELKKKINEDLANKKIEREIPQNTDSKPEYYVGMFLGYVNRKEYQKAYDVLNTEFKNNNFKNIENFIIYCNNKYGGYVTINIDKYKIVNNVFIIETKLTKLSNLEEFNQVFTMKVIDDNGKFEISFGI